jgi:hypothetical protein
MGHPHIITWAYVLTLSQATECTVPLDRIYSVMALVREDLRVAADYSISEGELLRRILQKHTESCCDNANELWVGMPKTLSVWHEVVQVDQYPVLEGQSELLKNLRFTFGKIDLGKLENDVHLILEDVNVPVVVC